MALTGLIREHRHEGRVLRAGDLVKLSRLARKATGIYRIEGFSREAGHGGVLYPVAHVYGPVSGSSRCPATHTIPVPYVGARPRRAVAR